MSDTNLIDWEQLEMIFGEDEEDFDDDMAELFQEFLEDVVENFGQIDALDFEANREAIGKLTHKIKGSSSNFGFAKVAITLAHIEDNIQSIGLDDFNQSLASAKADFEVSQKEIFARYPALVTS
tara:strand:- start:1844 stop:2215 length:372 start_codon:yes stop_codon:yes gene_type:complete